MNGMDKKRLKALKRDEIDEMVSLLRYSDSKSRKLFAEKLFTEMDDDERKRWFNLFAGKAYPAQRWYKIEKWIESHYKNNYEWTPRKMAATYLNYSGIDSRMMPLLINRARRTKNKLRMRKKREEAKNG